MTTLEAPRELPFKASLDIPLDLLRYKVWIDLQGQGGTSFFEDAESLVTTFVDAAGAGMFPADDFGPGASTMEVESISRLSSTSVRFVCRVEALEPKSFRLLLSMFAQLHQISQPWGWLNIRAFPDSIRRLTLPDLLATKVWFPKVAHGLPFDLEMDESITNRELHVVRLEFANALAPAQFQWMGEALENWNLLVMFGAFRDDFDEMDTFDLAPGQTYLVTASAIEHTLQTRLPPSVLLGSLVNLAVKAHLVLSPLERLELA